jgi:hypothetical protein
VHRDAWLRATTRAMRIEVLTERFAEFDLDAVKVTMRKDLKPAYVAGNHTGLTHNVGLL